MEISGINKSVLSRKTVIRVSDQVIHKSKLHKYRDLKLALYVLYMQLNTKAIMIRSLICAFVFFSNLS